jgi:anaphase-promoting complex subunit 1
MAANRTLSQPTGYGMVLFKSISPPVAEPLVLSEFDLSGRIRGTKSVINFDPNILGQDYMNWPEFHRGTATALQISSDDGTATDCSWILFNRPNEPDAYHAGFLYGLGLTGHLVKLSYYQSFEYLNAKHDMTSVGLLLGLSASFIGTMNETITKLVSLHIPAFLPPYSTDLNLSSVLQSAALISMGLLYCESGHRRTAEIMASEIGRKFLSVSDINNAYRDGHALAAGFALGLTLLGKGSAGNIQLVDQLRLYINGGKMNFADPSSQECSNRPGVQALSNRFKDGNEVNTHITAGPSIIALGLMFIRSENKSVAALVETPDTAIMLENVRPDLLIIREISRNLIMWNSIRSEQSWLDSRASMPVNVPFTDTDYLRCCILSGACFAIGLRFAGSGIFSIRDLLLEKFDFVHHGTKELGTFLLLE